MRYFKKIAGERVYLSPMNVDDVEIKTKWLNDFEVSGHLGQYRDMISLAGEKKWIEEAVISSTEQHYSIVLQDGDVLIGSIGLMEINHICRRATVGLFIGEAEKRGKGYGAEALRLILDYGFKMLNLHNIMLNVHSDNPQGIACYKKVGFKEFGRRHEARYGNGQYFDVVYMEILDTEFYQK